MLSSWSGRSRPRLALLRLEDRTVPATIAGVVYTDLDGDGLFDPGETPVPGSPIELRNSIGTVINSTTTDTAGAYSFATDNTIVVSPTTLQQTATVPLTATNFSTTVSIPQFDPALGTLTGVTVRLDGTVQADLQFENLDPSPATVTGTLRAQINLNRPDNSLLVSALPTRTTSDAVSDFDDVIDFGGTSGRTFLALTGTASAVANLPPPASDLLLFTGTGTIDLPLTTTGLSTAAGANLATAISTSAAAAVTVTYSYIPSNAIRPGNYTVVQTAQPAGLLDGPESQGGAVIPGSVGTDTIPVTVEAVTDVLPDNNFGEVAPAPAIALVKLTNGTNNDAPPGLVVALGSTVTFTYVVTNPGNVPLAGVTVRDDNGTPGFVSDDFLASFVGGDANADGLLDLAETWTYTASRVATPGQYTNVATATATAAVGNAPASATNPDSHFGTGAAVRLVSLTSATDNPAAPGPSVTVGKTVVFLYAVTNPGSLSLADVTVTDDAGTPADPADDFTATLAGGDTNGDGLLDPTEQWVFTATHVVTAGQYTNVSTVTALQVDGPAVTATDVDHHFGVVPVVAAGAGPGDSPQVKLLNADGSVRTTIQAFDPGFLGGVRVAVGDVTGDGVNDVIAGAGPGAGSHVKVFDGVTNAEVRSFFAFSGFAGGVFVGSGDIDGDGHADIIVGAGAGGAPHVKVFSGATGAELRSFFAFAPDFSGGVTVAGGDLTDDGIADVVVGAAVGSHVKVFDGATGAEERSFFAFGAAFTGGVFVAAGDLDCDGREEIIVGAGPGGGPHVKVFDGATNVVVRSFFAFAPGSTGGVRVAAGEVNSEGMEDLIVGSGTGSEVKAQDGTTAAGLFDVTVFGPATQGVFVG